MLFRRLLLRVLAPATFLLAALASACADQPRIWFENQRDYPVTISIDGDRLIILWPRTGQFLPYSTAAWAWPRRLEVARYDGGERLWSEMLDADDLTRRRWLYFIQPEQAAAGP